MQSPARQRQGNGPRWVSAGFLHGPMGPRRAAVEVLNPRIVHLGARAARRGLSPHRGRGRWATGFSWG